MAFFGIGSGIQVIRQALQQNRKRRAMATLSDELAEMRRVTSTVMDAWSYSMTPAGMVEQLGEVDEQLIDLLLDMRRYERVIGRGAGDPSEADRLRAVNYARYMKRTDVLTDVATDMWTDFGFGQVVDIVPSDPIGLQVWNETWVAPRNRPLFAQDSLHELFSDKILTDGEVFFVAWASTLDGSTMWRQFSTDQVKEIISSPVDGALKLWYIVEMESGEQFAFPDAFALFSFPDAFDAEVLPRDVVNINADANAQEKGTFAVIVAAQRNVLNGRGWPQFTLAFPWSEAYKQMIEDHAAVVSLISKYVDKITVKSGRRAVDALRSSLQSSLVTSDTFWDTNPPPSPGGTWLQNEQVNRERMPLTTGGLDSQRDTLVMLAQTSTAYKIPAFYLGRGDMMQNKAVADAATRPAIESWKRYQVFWSARFGDLVETTLRLKNKFGGLAIADFSAAINMASPLDIDTGDLTSAMDSITNAAGTGMLDLGVAQRANVVLTKLLFDDFSVSDPSGIIEPPEELPQELAPLMKVLMTAKENYQQGHVDGNGYFEFLAMELGELVK